jgi:hypothetical protein
MLLVKNLIKKTIIIAIFALFMIVPNSKAQVSKASPDFIVDTHSILSDSCPEFKLYVDLNANFSIKKSGSWLWLYPTLPGACSPVEDAFILDLNTLRIFSPPSFQLKSKTLETPYFGWQDTTHNLNYWIPGCTIVITNYDNEVIHKLNNPQCLINTRKNPRFVHPYNSIHFRTFQLRDSLFHCYTPVHYLYGKNNPKGQYYNNTCMAGFAIKDLIIDNRNKKSINLFNLSLCDLSNPILEDHYWARRWYHPDVNRNRIWIMNNYCTKFASYTLSGNQEHCFNTPKELIKGHPGILLESNLNNMLAEMSINSNIRDNQMRRTDGADTSYTIMEMTHFEILQDTLIGFRAFLIGTQDTHLIRILSSKITSKESIIKTFDQYYTTFSIYQYFTIGDDSKIIREVVTNNSTAIQPLHITCNTITGFKNKDINNDMKPSVVTWSFID